MEEKEMTPQEWEISVKEKMAAIEDEEQLLDIAQDITIRLANELDDAKNYIRNDGEVFSAEVEVLRLRIGRMAVMLDVLQLRYGDCAEEELAFMKNIEGCLEE